MLRIKDKIALAFLFTLQDEFVIGTLDQIVDIERTTGLDL